MTINLKSRQNKPKNDKKRIATLLGVMAILLSFFISCHHRPATLQYQTLDLQGWKATDTIKFEIDSLYEAGTYRLCATVRTSAAKPYEFRDLVVEVRQRWSPMEEEYVDTVDFQISAPDGEIEGKGVTLFTYEQPARTLQLSVGAKAQVEVRHLMRRTPLKGISDVGIHLVK